MAKCAVDRMELAVLLDRRQAELVLRLSQPAGEIAEGIGGVAGPVMRRPLAGELALLAPRATVLSQRF